VYESICYTVEHQLTTGALDRYNCSTSQHLKLLHEDTQYLLAMAFADKALYGIESPAELWKMDIPDGDDELPLRWNDEVLACAESCAILGVFFFPPPTHRPNLTSKNQSA